MDSVIRHVPGTFYVELREDYIQLCQQCSVKKEKSKSSSHCKALILSILERWTNNKLQNKLPPIIAMTHPQWIDAMYGMFARNVIIDSLEELTEEGWIGREAYKPLGGGKNQYKYWLHPQAINTRLATFTNQPFIEATYNQDISSPIEEGMTPPSSTQITSEGKAIYEWYIAPLKRKPSLTEKLIEECNELGLHVQTPEAFKSLEEYTREHTPNKPGLLYIKNFLNNVNGWSEELRIATAEKSAQAPQSTLHLTEEARAKKKAELERQMVLSNRLAEINTTYYDNPQDKYAAIREAKLDALDQDEKIFWNNTGSGNFYDRDPDHWEEMTIRQARTLGFRGNPLPDTGPGGRQDIEARQRAKAKREALKPQPMPSREELHKMPV